MNVLAIDPGLTTGYAHSRGAHGTWEFGGHAHPGGPAAGLIEAIVQAPWPIELIVTEGSYPISRRGADRLEWMRGAVQIAAYRLGSIPVKVVAPASLKLYATGDGRAEKEQMMRACQTQLGITPKDSNECDAIWLLHWARCKKPAARAERPKKTKRAQELPF